MWKNNTREYFWKSIPRAIYFSCIDIVECPNALFIMVKKSPRPVIVKTNMYTRDSTGCFEVIDTEVICNIMTDKTSCPKASMKLDMLQYGDTFPYSEGKNMEFKHWSNFQLLHLIQKLNEDRTKRALFAFPNIPNGGDIILGIEEDKETKANIVKGIPLSTDEQEKFARELLYFMSHGFHEWSPVWSETGHLPELGKDIEVEFFQVQNAPTNACNVLVRIHIQKYIGGVFANAADAYTMSEDGYIQYMDIKQCKSSILSIQQTDAVTDESDKTAAQTDSNINNETVNIKVSPKQSGTPEAGDKPGILGNSYLNTRTSTSSTISDKKRHAVYVDSEDTEMDYKEPSKAGTIEKDVKPSKPPKPPKPTPPTPPPPKTGITEQEMEHTKPLPSSASSQAQHQRTVRMSVLSEDELENILKDKNEMSWTECSSHWSEDEGNKNANAENDRSLCGFTSPLTFIPSREILENCWTSKVKMKSTLDAIDRVYRGVNGIAIASKSWVSNFDNESAQQEEDANHILDFVIITESMDIDLWSVYDTYSLDSMRTRIVNTLLTCRLIKMKLLMKSDEQKDVGINTLCITPYICHADSGQHERIYDKKNNNKCRSLYFRMMCTEICKISEQVKMKLISIAMKRNLLIKSKIGEEHLVTLTEDQVSRVLSTDTNRFNVICGPPGSGKTIMALHICKKHGGKKGHEKVAYWCTSPGTKAFIDYQDKCQAYLVQSDKDLRMLIKSKDFLKHRCLILDDMHHINCKYETWNKLYEAILGNKHTVLYIFFDNRFQNFKEQAQSDAMQRSLLEFCQKHGIPLMMKDLTEVLRNSRKVFSFMKANMALITVGGIVQQNDMFCTHNYAGDDVKTRYVPNLRESGASNGLVFLIKSLIDKTHSMEDGDFAYVAYDITLLVDHSDKNKAEKAASFYRKLLSMHLGPILVHDAQTFPVTGITVDTVDNFMGLESRVLLFIVDEGKKRTFFWSTKTIVMRTLQNPKYKLYLASRGITRVEFLLPKPLDKSTVVGMKYQQLHLLSEEEIDEYEVYDDILEYIEPVAHIPTGDVTEKQVLSVEQKPENKFQTPSIDKTRITLQHKIGEGNFGTVHQGEYKSTSGDLVQVAVKTIKEYFFEINKDDILNEARIHAGLDNPNIIKLIGIIENPTTIRIVTELAPLGPMHKYLQKNRNTTLKKITILLHCVAKGMLYLESQHVVHRDLAARNILIFNDEMARISDFGLSRALSKSDDCYQASVAGKWPLKWFAPECIYYFKFSTKSDVWSFGIVMWEAISYGKKLYKGMKGTAIIEMLEQGRRLGKPNQCPDSLYSLMMKCWEYEADMRPSFSDLVRLLSLHMESLADTEQGGATQATGTTEPEDISTKDYLRPESFADDYKEMGQRTSVTEEYYAYSKPNKKS